MMRYFLHFRIHSHRLSRDLATKLKFATDKLEEADQDITSAIKS